MISLIKSIKLVIIEKFSIFNYFFNKYNLPSFSSEKQFLVTSNTASLLGIVKKEADEIASLFRDTESLKIRLNEMKSNYNSLIDYLAQNRFILDTNLFKGIEEYMREIHLLIISLELLEDPMADGDKSSFKDWQDARGEYNSCKYKLVPKIEKLFGKNL